ncbi:uncharacterized protein LOC119591734 [Penaeus monodon]|uniref:uncharacterized protein LOC119591734 n=1 Tax=Penaeus monodon TaxID=6687 RepID=UPI0018A7707D|nr:uncharacterized protein LOC119591734 [Penaeus monodon]
MRTCFIYFFFPRPGQAPGEAVRGASALQPTHQIQLQHRSGQGQRCQGDDGAGLCGIAGSLHPRSLCGAGSDSRAHTHAHRLARNTQGEDRLSDRDCIKEKRVALVFETGGGANRNKEMGVLWNPFFPNIASYYLFGYKIGYLKLGLHVPMSF